MSEDGPVFKSDDSKFARPSENDNRRLSAASTVSGKPRRTPKDLDRELMAKRRAESWAAVKTPLVTAASLTFFALVFLLPGWLRDKGVLPKLKVPSPQLASVGGYSTSSDPCRLKKKCLVLFLAPWCPSCHGSLGFISAVRANLRESTGVGVKVIVGNDDESALKEFAHQIGGQVFLDSSNQFWGKVDRGGVPRWWITNDKQEILQSGSGLWSDTDPQTVRHILTSEWKL